MKVAIATVVDKFRSLPGWVVVLLAALGASGCNQAVTSQDVSKQLQQVVEGSDSEAMAGFVSEEELQRQGVTRRQLGEFFKRELFGNWKATGEPSREQDSFETVTLIMPLESKVGDQVLNMALVCLPGDHGVEVPQLVKLVIWHNAMAIARKEGRPTDPASRHRHVASYLKVHSARLEKDYGLKGLYYDDEGSVVNWENVQKRYVEWADRFDARAKAAGAR